MNILWSPQAIEDLNSLRAYIAQDNPSAARAVALHVAHSIEQLLSDNPQMGRPSAALLAADGKSIAPAVLSVVNRPRDVTVLW